MRTTLGTVVDALEEPAAWVVPGEGGGMLCSSSAKPEDGISLLIRFPVIVHCVTWLIQTVGPPDTRPRIRLPLHNNVTIVPSLSMTATSTPAPE